MCFSVLINSEPWLGGGRQAYLQGFYLEFMSLLWCLLPSCCLWCAGAELSFDELVCPLPCEGGVWSLHTVKAVLSDVQNLCCVSQLAVDVADPWDDHIPMAKVIVVIVSEIQAMASWPRACDGMVPHRQSVWQQRSVNTQGVSWVERAQRPSIFFKGRAPTVLLPPTGLYVLKIPLLPDINMGWELSL